MIYLYLALWVVLALLMLGFQLWVAVKMMIREGML